LWLEFHRKPIEQRVVVVVVVVVIVDTLLSSLAKCSPSLPFLSLPSFLIFYSPSPHPFVVMMMSSKEKVPPFCGYKLVVGREKGRGGVVGEMGCSHFVKITCSKILLLFIKITSGPPPIHQYNWPFTLDEKKLQASNWVWTLDLYN